MKVIVDDKIPYIREALSAMGVEAVYLPGSTISPEAVRDADALAPVVMQRCSMVAVYSSLPLPPSAMTISTPATVLHMVSVGPMHRAAMPPRYANMCSRSCCSCNVSRGSSSQKRHWVWWE